MRSHLQTLVRYGSLFALLSWAGLIVYLSSLGQNELQPLEMPIPYWDKVLHLCAFAVGGGLQAAMLKAWTGWRHRWLFICAIMLISFFGAIDEWHQLYTPTRSGADIGDWVADTIGALLGIWTTLKVWPMSLQKFLSSAN